jgi:hypothetical protein
MKATDARVRYKGNSGGSRATDTCSLPLREGSPDCTLDLYWKRVCPLCWSPFLLTLERTFWPRFAFAPWRHVCANTASLHLIVAMSSRRYSSKPAPASPAATERSESRSRSKNIPPNVVRVFEQSSSVGLLIRCFLVARASTHANSRPSSRVPGASRESLFPDKRLLYPLRR